MNFLLLVIAAILGFIAYQLHQFKFDFKSEKESRQEEEKINEMMPHLYKKSSRDGVKKDIRDYVDSNDNFRKYDLLQESVRSQTDLVTKEKMEKALKKIGNTIVEARKQLDKTMATEDEKMYLLWNHCKRVYEDFPDAEIREGAFDDFLLFSGFGSMLPNKENANL